MTILDITDITRKETCIYYRREFSGSALYDLPGRKTSGKIEFTIETAPTGKSEIQIRLVDPVEYPLLPVLQGLKQYIASMDADARLP